MLTVRVLFFGHYRDIVSDGSVLVPIADGATVADLARLLAERDPRLADLLIRTRVAVAGDFAPSDTVLKDGDEVAFLPPMSGG